MNSAHSACAVLHSNSKPAIVASALALTLFVGHIDFARNCLCLAIGGGTFTDATIPTGLGKSNFLNRSFGARLFDFDNDGWHDLLAINGHILDNIAAIIPT